MIKVGESYTITIDSLTENGYGLGIIDKFKVFVIGGITGDTVTIRIKKKKRRYAYATILSFTTPSKMRQKSPCQHFPDCGGCQLIDMDYHTQIKLKEQLFHDAYTHLFPNLTATIKPIIANDSSLFYRNKMEFSFGYHQEKLTLGLKKRGCFDTVIPTPYCQLQSPLTHQLLEKTLLFFQTTSLTAWNYHTHTGCLRHLMIRHSKSTNTVMLNLIVSENHPRIYQQFVQTITQQLPEIVSIYLSIQPRAADTTITEDTSLIFGNETLIESIGDSHYAISPQSFFQTNSIQAKSLYDEVINAASPTPSDIVYDLYCGTGTIGLYIAPKVHSVYGIEEVNAAIQNAIHNATINTVTNCHFFVGRVKNILKEIIAQKRPSIPRPDCVIIDPPRAGIVPKALHRILSLNAPKVVYVSCNPATFLRDLKAFLDSGYQLNYIQPVDMFPNTFHLETVAQLEKVSPSR